MTKTILLFGATSQIGDRLLPNLIKRGYQVYPVSRSVHRSGFHTFLEGSDLLNPPLEKADALICLAPLPVIEKVLRVAAPLGIQRVIAFGSYSRFSKEGSTSLLERDFVEQQIKSELVLKTQCEQLGISWTLFRPTMIYGADRDLNIAFIKKIIQRLKLFFIPFGARGLRQPVHVDDLATACCEALENPTTFGKAYNLGGGEVLIYPEMVRRIFRMLGQPPVLISIPRFLFQVMFYISRTFAGAQFLRSEMIDRMYVDLVADNDPAVRDFGFRPRGFGEA